MRKRVKEKPIKRRERKLPEGREHLFVGSWIALSKQEDFGLDEQNRLTYRDKTITFSPVNLYSYLTPGWEAYLNVTLREKGFGDTAPYIVYKRSSDALSEALCEVESFESEEVENVANA